MFPANEIIQKEKTSQDQRGVKRPVVNGKEIDVQAVKLNANDTIELAGTRMNFMLVPQ